MAFTLNKDMKSGERFGASGHVTSWAYTDEYADKKSIPEKVSNEISSQNSNAIYKANKHNNPGLSELEVGISAVWEVCLSELTARYDLVVDAAGTAGVLSKKLDNFTPMGNEAEDIKALSSLHKQELAGILVMCYCLEEDDLHRNNIGTATVNGETHMVKIDHDMSFYQSISSVSGNRRGYLRVNDEHRFKVTEQDIFGFPILTSANIHYWPTKDRLLEGSPGYKSKALRAQFKALKNDAEFQAAKYAAFLEFINVDPEAVRKNIELRMGDTKPETTNMIVDAFVARQAEVRCTLLTMPEAKSYLYAHPEMQPVVGSEKNKRVKLFRADTPLHIALHSECFHHLDLNKHKLEINIKNSKNETPLMLAIKLNNISAMESLLHQGAKITYEDLQILSRNTDKIANKEMKVLLNENEKMKEWLSYPSSTNSKARSLLIENAKSAEKLAVKTIENLIDADHLDKRNKMELGITGLTNLADAANVELSNIRDNVKLSLAQKKEAAVQFIQLIVKQVKKPEELSALFQLVEHPDFQFIRQLTTDFWLLRQLRGSHGVTTTYKTIHHEIHAAATKLLSAPNNFNEKELNELKLVKSKSLESESKIETVAALFTHRHDKPVHLKDKAKKSTEDEPNESPHT